MKKSPIFLLFMLPVAVFAGRLSLYIENDLPFEDDSDYSHGTRIEYGPGDGWKFGVQQQMYTPYDLRNSEQIPGRHPYAGYLVGFGGKRSVKKVKKDIFAYSDIELQLGVLGPASFAEQTQKFTHKLTGSRYPAGWDHQLQNEAVVQTALWGGGDWRFAGTEKGWSLHLVPEIGALLGTLQVAPGFNMELRAGYNTKSGQNDSEIGIRSVKKNKFSCFFLSGIETRCWLRNELLEGNASYVGNHDTLTVEKEDFTGCVKFGAGFGYDKFDVRVVILKCSREYTTQERTPNYASLTVGWSF